MSGGSESETQVTVPVKIIKILGLLLSAAITGGGSAIVVRSADPPAYDRFTGSDGDNLEREIKGWCKDKTVEKLEPIIKDVNKLEGAVETCREALSQLPPRYLLKNMESMARDIAIMQRDDAELEKKVKTLLRDVQLHDKEAEAWKRKIEINAQWITHLRGNGGNGK